MSWISKLNALTTVCVSVLLAFLIVEFGYRAIIDRTEKGEYHNRTMLFQAGNNFLNYEGYFKYFPNQDIRSLTLYSKKNPKNTDDIVIEYDYVIHTNNAGLVMRSNVIRGEQSTFIIGDSFTEGQGASPWFYQLEKDDLSAQHNPINLGILGTGPAQWKNLAESITEEFNLEVAGAIINILPDDMARKVWTFTNRELNCLHQQICNYNYGFQGYDFSQHQSNDDIKASVLTSLSFNDNSYKSNDYIKDFIKRSRVISDLRLFFNDQTSHTHRKINEDAILALRDFLRGNFYVNVISQKNINSTNYLHYGNGADLIHFLETNGIRYSWCDIPTKGFHTNDGHPNAYGYGIFLDCIKSSLGEINKSVES